MCVCMCGYLCVCVLCSRARACVRYNLHNIKYLGILIKYIRVIVITKIKTRKVHYLRPNARCLSSTDGDHCLRGLPITASPLTRLSTIIWVSLEWTVPKAQSHTTEADDSPRRLSGGIGSPTEMWKSVPFDEENSWRSTPLLTAAAAAKWSRQVARWNTPSASTVRPAGESMCTFPHTPLGHYCCVPLEPDELGTSQRGRQTLDQCPARISLDILSLSGNAEGWEHVWDQRIMGKWGNARDKWAIYIKTPKDTESF